MKRKKIITVALITLVAICLITTGISAANLIGADSVQYKDTTVKAALDDLMDKVNVSTCQDGALCSKVKLGDYVRMTPTSTTYSISRDLTNYSSDQTINPSELNLWRVISLNEDGTIDMVSEYVSSTNVYFYGRKGYLNFVGALNTIAKQYENSNYTIGSRHMGYNGQTEYITDTSKFTKPAPWTKSTTDNSNESLGGGDILYLEDYYYVRGIIGTLSAYTPGDTMATEYWLASRYYFYGALSSYRWSGRSVNTSGSVNNDKRLYIYNSSGWGSDSYSGALRPIVTLRSDVSATSGSGTSSAPWVLG